MLIPFLMTQVQSVENFDEEENFGAGVQGVRTGHSEGVVTGLSEELYCGLFF
jgi:hypothetical protein